jgi:hypothetical protein
MAPRPGRPFLVLLAFFAVGVIGAGVAWACSPGAESSGTPGKGPAGTQVQLEGKGFPAGQIVRIKWAAGGEERYLTSARPDAQGVFVKSVAVPADASDGEAVFLTVPADPQYTQRVSFVVGPQRTPAPPGQPGPGGSDPAQPGPGARPDLAPPGSGGGAPGPEVVRDRTNGRPGPRSPGPRGDRSPRNGGSPRNGASPPAPNRGTAPADAAAPAGRTSTGEPAFTGSVGPGNKPTAVAPDRAITATGSGEVPQPSEATANGDLWGGFGSGSNRPSLSDVAGPADSPGSALTVGIALLALSILGLVATFAVAELRRRRVLGERRSD